MNKGYEYISLLHWLFMSFYYAKMYPQPLFWYKTLLFFKKLNEFIDLLNRRAKLICYFAEVNRRM